MSFTTSQISSKERAFDVVIVGAGPNGLSAGIALAEQGLEVLILEMHPRPGGGLRCSPLTHEGFVHDHCAAVHPMGILSPFWSRLDLASHGLTWRWSDVSAAHPLRDGSAALLLKSIEATARSLGDDGDHYQALIQPFLRPHPRQLVEDLVMFKKLPKQPWNALRFGLLGLRSTQQLAKSRFRGELGQALLAGCGAHSILPLDFALTGAMSLMFCLTAHVQEWPVVEGGSERLAEALASYFQQLGGVIECERRVEKWDALPPARCYLFDTSPKEVLKIVGDRFPAAYRGRLGKYRYGPGVFKMDFALSEAIPWKARECGRASTVHVGGTLREIAHSEKTMWEGKVSEKPFVMVCQQSALDGTRAPAGQHTGYAYIHVPEGFDGDCRDVIRNQLEDFAPGFQDCILAQSVTRPADFERYNPAFVGGTVTGGVGDWRQMITRPVARLDPYSTPLPDVYLCSAATPPGGGVHGMCGYLAAGRVLKRHFQRSLPPLSALPKWEGA